MLTRAEEWLLHCGELLDEAKRRGAPQCILDKLYRDMEDAQEVVWEEGGRK